VKDLDLHKERCSGRPWSQRLEQVGGVSWGKQWAPPVHTSTSSLHPCADTGQSVGARAWCSALCCEKWDIDNNKQCSGLGQACNSRTACAHGHKLAHRSITMYVLKMKEHTHKKVQN